jgi:hypothetical protein
MCLTRKNEFKEKINIKKGYPKVSDKEISMHYNYQQVAGI